MGIDRIMNTSAYFQSVQYSNGIPEIQEEEDTGLSESEPEVPERTVDMDRLDFEEGDRAILQLMQNRGKGVYETVSEDPALAWSVKGQTYPSAMRINKRV